MSLVEKPAVVFDFGDAHIRVGFAGEAAPRCILRRADFLAKAPSTCTRADISSLQPAVDAMLSRIFLRHLLVMPTDRRIVLLELPDASWAFRDSLLNGFFRCLCVASVSFVPLLCMPSVVCESNTCLVVDCGTHSTRCLPLVDGHPLMAAYSVSPVAGQTVRETLRNLIVLHGVFAQSLEEVEMLSVPSSPVQKADASATSNEPRRAGTPSQLLTSLAAAGGGIVDSDTITSVSQQLSMSSLDDNRDEDDAHDNNDEDQDTVEPLGGFSGRAVMPLSLSRLLPAAARRELWDFPLAVLDDITVRGAHVRSFHTLSSASTTSTTTTTAAASTWPQPSEDAHSQLKKTEQAGVSGPDDSSEGVHVDESAAQASALASQRRPSAAASDHSITSFGRVVSSMVDADEPTWHYELRSGTQKGSKGALILTRNILCNACEPVFRADGIEDLSAVRVVRECLAKCSCEVRSQLMQRILFVGGTSMIPGLERRFCQELEQSILNDERFAGKSPVATVECPFPENIRAWMGGSIYAAVQSSQAYVVQRQAFLNKDPATTVPLPDWFAPSLGRRMQTPPSAVPLASSSLLSAR